MYRPFGMLRPYVHLRLWQVMSRDDYSTHALGSYIKAAHIPENLITGLICWVSTNNSDGLLYRCQHSSIHPRYWYSLRRAELCLLKSRPRCTSVLRPMMIDRSQGTVKTPYLPGVNVQRDHLLSRPTSNLEAGLVSKYMLPEFWSKVTFEHCSM